MKNTGVLTGKRPEDYEAGRVGASLQYEVINDTADWDDYLPPGEWQRSKYVDSMACVSYSALNIVETQIKFLTGLDINLSDPFTAKMSGTTPQGNYLYKVADSLRLDGAVLESDWPTPPDFTWDTFYKEIPSDIINRGKEFLEAVDISYEWISDLSKENIIKHLKHAPIQIVILSNTHAVELYKEEDVHYYFDHYEPFRKTSTELTWPMKIVVKIKDEQKLREFAKIGMTEEQAKKLCWAVFRREADQAFLDHYTGKDLTQALIDITSSEEWNEYNDLFAAGKSIEEWAYERGRQV